MTNGKNVFKIAFIDSIPVLAGYGLLGIAYGILMSINGYGLIWSIPMSIFGFAGSAQYFTIVLLTSAYQPIYALIMLIIVNARHIFYGISMLEKYKNEGKIKLYLIFGLTDETFSIVSTKKNISKEYISKYYLFVTLLNHIYWVTGTLIGGLIASIITFNTYGMEFALTALFVVIFVNQWKQTTKHTPALIGLASTVICLYIFGSTNFIIPAMILITINLFIYKKYGYHHLESEVIL